jgi:RimJ/RimL family protein N-acetyltransferase
MRLTVRHVSEDDAESVREALDSVARERRYILMVEAPPLDDVRRFIAESILSDDPYYIAANGKEIVGFCAITRRKEAGFGHVGRLGMGVVAPHRHEGLGRKLLRATTDHAGRVGITRIELEVFSSNAPAIRLYESFGFITECVRRRVRYLDGVWDDMVQMVMVTDDVSLQPRQSANRSSTVSKGKRVFRA